MGVLDQNPQKGGYCIFPGGHIAYEHKFGSFFFYYIINQVVDPKVELSSY